MHAASTERREEEKEITQMKAAIIPVEQLEKLKDLVRNQTGLAISVIDGYIDSAVVVDGDTGHVDFGFAEAKPADDEAAPVEKEEGKGKKGKQ